MAVLSHEGIKPQSVTCKVSRLDKKDAFRVTDVYEFTAQVGAYDAVSVSLPWEVTDEALIVCDVLDAAYQDRSFYNEGILALVRAEEALQVIHQDENSITVTSNQYVHVVELEGEYVFSDNYFSLMPGEKKVIYCRKNADCQNAALSVCAYSLK